MLRIRQLVALLCLAALLFAALAPDSHGLAPTWITPFWIFLAILVCFSVANRERECDPRPFPTYTVVPSRAPPSA
jgi:peptidoglycan/LPS O-acetylase OafA/YrhL